MKPEDLPQTSFHPVPLGSGTQFPARDQAQPANGRAIGTHVNINGNRRMRQLPARCKNPLEIFLKMKLFIPMECVPQLIIHNDRISRRAALTRKAGHALFCAGC